MLNAAGDLYTTLMYYKYSIASVSSFAGTSAGIKPIFNSILNIKPLIKCGSQLITGEKPEGEKLTC